MGKGSSILLVFPVVATPQNLGCSLHNTMGKKASKRCTVCLGFTFPICFLAGVALIVGGVALYLKFPSVITGQVDKVSPREWDLAVVIAAKC